MRLYLDLRPEKIPADRYGKLVVLHEMCHVATRQAGARVFFMNCCGVSVPVAALLRRIG